MDEDEMSFAELHQVLRAGVPVQINDSGLPEIVDQPGHPRQLVLRILGSTIAVVADSDRPTPESGLRMKLEAAHMTSICV